VKFLSKNIQLRDKVTFGDFEKILVATGYILKSKSKWEIINYQNEIIKILTHIKKPRWYHRSRIREILDAAGFIRTGKKSDKPISSIIDDARELIKRASAFLGMSPRVIRDDYTDDELQAAIVNKKKLNIEHYLRMLYLTHSHKYAETLIKEFNSLQSKEKLKKSDSGEIEFGGNKVKNKIISMQDILDRRREIVNHGR